MRDLLESYDERLLVGEIYLPLAEVVAYYGPHGEGAQLPFNFQLIRSAWTAATLAECISRYEGELPAHAWPNWVLGNHDNSRIASRLGPQRAAMAAVLLLTLRGTPFLYYGDEIGMTDVDVPKARVQDPLGSNSPRLSRDPERTPMQWDDSREAGFTTGEPWLPVGPQSPRVNVAAQRTDPDSLLSLYRRLIHQRRVDSTLVEGPCHPLVTGNDILAFERWAGGVPRYLTAANLGDARQEMAAPGVPRGGTIVIATRSAREGKPVRGSLALEPGEAVLVRIDG
jgi:alpha-glucosidase